jgi:hypothetical protein
MPLTSDRERALHNRAYHQRLVMFFVVVFAFSVVSIRTEFQNQRMNEQQHALEVTNLKIADTQYRECLTRNESARNLNRILDAIVSAVHTAPGLSAAERERRIALYVSAKSNVFDCGKDPTP